MREESGEREQLTYVIDRVFHPGGPFALISEFEDRDNRYIDRSSLLAALQRSIDWHGTGQGEVEFEHDGSHWYGEYSCPTYYTLRHFATWIVDLAVVGPSREDVRRIYDKEKDDRESARRTMQEIVSNYIIPAVGESSTVETVLGRGTIFDPDRVTEEDPDIDLVVFVNFELSQREEREALLMSLRNVREVLPDMSISARVYQNESGGRDEMLHMPDRPDPKNIHFDVVHLSSVDDIRRIVGIDEYALRQLAVGAVLLDRSGGTYTELAQEALSAR